MSRSIAVGMALLTSNSTISAAASAFGVAKTGTAIGTLNGVAFTNATAAWVGFGSMQAGSFLMGALPVVGVLLILDGISGCDHGSPIIDWYEEGWRQYEIQCELEELKQEVEVDVDHQLRSKTRAASFAQQETQFRALEVEHELHLLKKELGIKPNRSHNKAKKISQRTLTELDCKSLYVLNTPNVGLKVRVSTTGMIGSIVSEYFDMKLNKHMLGIKPIDGSHTTFAAFSDASLVAGIE